MRNYEALLIEQPAVWEDYTPEGEEDDVELSAEIELNFEE